MDNEGLNRNLVILLKMFKNRPYHLAKYLIENSALSKDFIDKLINSDKLNDLSEDDYKEGLPVFFIDINQMDDFYKSFIIDDIKDINKEKTIEELTNDLNRKLDDYIRSEKYEDAARVRDYMSRNGIKRINNF